MVKKGKKGRKRITETHRRVGKRLVPPMMQLPAMQSMSYIDDMLPELIWLGLVNDELGFVEGSQFFQEFVKIANEVCSHKPAGNFSVLSLYRRMSQEEQAKLIETLADNGLVQTLQRCVAPLTTLYDQFPLAFIGLPDDVPSQEKLLETMKECVGRHLDKYETPGIALNGMMLISRLVTKTIKISRDIPMPDFEAIFHSPDSSEAHRAAGFLRSNALAEFGQLDVDPAWAKYFWNRGFELSPCTTYGDEEKA